MAEESGGAAMGPAEPVVSRHGDRTSLAPKEKDAMQIGVMALCLAARLHTRRRQLRRLLPGTAGEVRHALPLLRAARRHPVRRVADRARPVSEARAAGNARKEATVAFFAAPGGQGSRRGGRRSCGPACPRGRNCRPSSGSSTPATAPSSSSTGQWFELRASGTDAVLRYYMEGGDPAAVSGLNEAFTRLVID